MESQKAHVAGLFSFDFTLNMKLVCLVLLHLLCWIICVTESQDVFSSVTEAQILDDNVTDSFFTYSLYIFSLFLTFSILTVKDAF